ncbi:MAG: cation-transporting P-type ATPase, partial [Trebonia sp.]
MCLRRRGPSRHGGLIDTQRDHESGGCPYAGTDRRSGHRAQQRAGAVPSSRAAAGHQMTSGAADTARSGRPLAGGEPAWHRLGADQVLHSEGVDGQRGLSSADVAERAQRFGPNEFAADRAEPRWHAFFRQYRDTLQLVLLAAGIGSLYPLKQLGTGILLVLLTLFNAVEGLH